MKRPAAPELLHKKLLKFAAFFSGSKRVLELGCGWGEFLELFKSQGRKAEGVDLDSDRTVYCRERGWIVHNAKAADFLRRCPAGRFDGIFMSNVIEHLEMKEARDTLKLAWRVLPRGGRIAMTTANPRSLAMLTEFWHDAQHTRPYPLPVLREMLEALGFKVLKAEADEDSRPQGWMRWMIRKLRSLLVGPYFEPSEIYILAEKP